MTKQERMDKLNARGGFNRYAGLVVSELEEGFCAISGELNENTCTPWGSAHGGFLFTLCDVAAGYAFTQGEKSCVTLSGNIFYLLPATGRKLRAEGRLIKAGRTVALAEADVYDEQGRRVVHGDFQFYLT